MELHRGWNSRLGFSLQAKPADVTETTMTAEEADRLKGGVGIVSKTVISAIYSDSVAAKDGRLKVGDQVLMVCYSI